MAKRKPEFQEIVSDPRISPLKPQLSQSGGIYRAVIFDGLEVMYGNTTGELKDHLLRRAEEAAKRGRKPRQLPKVAA